MVIQTEKTNTVGLKYEFGGKCRIENPQKPML